MPFQCACGGDVVESSVARGKRGAAFEVRIRCARCKEPVARKLTSQPVVYDDLLVELCASRAQELSHRELAFLVARTEAQVLAALLDLETAGLVHYLERDLDRTDLLDRWAPADSLQSLRISAWLDDSVFDLSDDIESSSAHEEGHYRIPGGATAEVHAAPRF